MSNNYREQAMYDYRHENKIVKGKILKNVLRHLNKLNFKKDDYSRLMWYKHRCEKRIDNKIDELD